MNRRRRPAAFCKAASSYTDGQSCRKHPADGLLAFALTLPEAWEDLPWEEDLVAKVGAIQ